MLVAQVMPGATQCVRAPISLCSTIHTVETQSALYETKGRTSTHEDAGILSFLEYLSSLLDITNMQLVHITNGSIVEVMWYVVLGSTPVISCPSCHMNVIRGIQLEGFQRGLSE